MPTIEISKQDLCKLIGKEIPINQLQEEGILYAKGEIEDIKGDLLKVEIKDTNRPDLWSTEGIARELRGRYTTPKFPEYTIQKSMHQVHVNKSLKNIRPYTTCAVVKGLNITEDVLSQMIQLQEKVSETFGRNRREIAVGVYDYNKIKWPINFTAIIPNQIKFAPLGFSKKMTPKQILEKHPKGKEYGHLLKGKPKYPIFIDDSGYVLSMPPIINSEHSGKVTTQTKDVFIECSGFNLEINKTALNVLVAALADRGGTIEQVEVVYPTKRIITPNLAPKKTKLDMNLVKNHLGISLKPTEIMNLLFKANYTGVRRGNILDLEYPAYRQDIMHSVDIIEDLIISYGYNNIKPKEPQFLTKGRQSERELFSRKAASIMTGIGLQETLSYTLTNHKSLFSRMGLGESHVVEIENPQSSRWNVFRNWLLPSILDFLSHNTTKEYPQKIFEIGDCITINERTETRTQDERKLCAALTDTMIGYEDIASVLDALLRTLGLKYTLIPHNHPSFIPGRSAKIVSGKKRLGLIGEIHPNVLNNWNIDAPTVAIEIDLDLVTSLLKE